MIERWKIFSDGTVRPQGIDYGPGGLKVVEWFDRRVVLVRDFPHSYRVGMGQTNYAPPQWFVAELLRKHVRVDKEGRKIIESWSVEVVWSTEITRARKRTLEQARQEAREVAARMAQAAREPEEVPWDGLGWKRCPGAL